MKVTIHILLCCGFLISCGRQPDDFDVVIYGGTSAGVIAAVQVHRMGMTAVLIEPGEHLGGLTSGGLGRTDTGNKSVIGGMSREFYQRLKQYYDQSDVWLYENKNDYSGYDIEADAIWGFEPHAAEEIYNEMLAETNVTVIKRERLDLNDGAMVHKNRIRKIRMQSGRVFRGDMFIDATYEGDLMAKAGVSYTVGRESNAKYNETLNGVQKRKSTNHQLKTGVDPYVEPGDPSRGVLPNVHPGDPGKDGQGDHRIQAYCFRMCLTDVPENRVAYPKPENYDEQEYELLFRNFEAGENSVPWLPGMMPNRKTDTNNRTGFSTDYIGKNYDYPEADYATRDSIVAAHERYQKGLMWTLANHPRVPRHIRDEISRWGLAKDEFVDNGNWPHQLYIREARRMIGEYVMTENDCKRKRIVNDPIGLGSYNMDSHNCQRYITADGFARNEGNIEVSPRGAYLISYRSITPKRDEIQNLLVPVCLSASHIAYGSIRMEPVFMILGQSAAAAAVLADKSGIPVQDIDYHQLRKQLLQDNQVLDLPAADVPHPDIDPKSLEGIVVDDSDALPRGSWRASHDQKPYVGGSYLHDQNGGKGSRWATYETRLPKSGRYEVRLSYTALQDRADRVPVRIDHSNGSDMVYIDQTRQPDIDHLFVSLGVYTFRADQRASVFISNKNTNGTVILDAVQWIPVP